MPPPCVQTRAHCPAHRPGYLCGGSLTYYRYQRGAWALRCAWPDFHLELFSKDHLRVWWVGGWGRWGRPGRQVGCVQ